MLRKKSKTKISCVILSYNSHIDKKNRVLLCLTSVFNQKFNDAEVVLVENSHDKSSTKKILTEVNKISRLLNNRFSFKIVNNKKSLSRGAARNKGAKKCIGDIIIFIDGDTIILDDNAFSKIYKLSQTHKYGFGANRLWINKKILSDKNLLENLKDSFYDYVKNKSFLPKNNNRAGFDAEILTKTFIGNFGFCERSLFFKSGGFCEFIGYGFEDDCLMYKLFTRDKKYALLDKISVAHIDHRVVVENYRNLIDYFCKLVKEKVYWFNSYMLFQKKFNINRAIEPLKLLHYDYIIQNCYKYYEKLIPLDIKNNKKDYSCWKKFNQYSIQEFSRIIDILINSDCLDNFIKNSSGDFDNLSIVIKSAIKFKLIKINKIGRIKKLYGFNFTKPYLLTNYEIKNFIPNHKLNQFPCNEASRKKRFEFIKSRYPFAEYLKFAIIGDDDFVSSEFANDYWAWPVIIEKDKRIINQIKKINKRFEVIEIDIAKPEKIHGLPMVQTFITDPPYTLNGSLAFIYLGLKMLEKNRGKKEFYVIVNETIIGSHFYKIEKILSESKVYIKEIIKNFSQYELPKNFIETKRAKKFLLSQGINKNSIVLSSSSSLYIFETINPNVSKIKKSINFNKLYQHYL
jgi:glycosyltransferase involved in cell wall biosynthesis